LLGLFALTPEGASGSAYQMLNHGVSTSALFLLFGMLYERRHLRLMADYGGLAKVMPAFAAVFLIITFSSIAVPGTNGFVGEFLVLLGTFKSDVGMGFGIAAATAVVLGAAYMLWMVQRVFFGQLTHRENMHLSDLNGREWAAALPFVLLVFLMGVRPQPVLDRLEASSDVFVARATFASNDRHMEFDGVKMIALGAEGRAPTLPAGPSLPMLPQPAALAQPPGAPERRA